MLDVIKPKIEVEIDDKDENYGKIVISPLERGYSTTLGNSLRRVLLSSLPGSAITSVKVDGVLHEFSTVTGVKEDVTEIILNLKGLAFITENTEEERKGYIDVKGPAVVTSKDITFDGVIEVADKDSYIATLDKDGKLKMEVTINSGWGYIPAEAADKDDLSVSEIPVDAIYTPMRTVNFTTEKTRVRNRTDFDKLTLELRTDGSITPTEAVSIASKIMMEHLALLTDLDVKAKELDVFTDEVVEEQTIAHSTSTRVEDIGLNQRSLNGLKRAGINVIEDIIVLTKDELINTRHIGEKSVEDIIERIHTLGFKLKGEEIE